MIATLHSNHATQHYVLERSGRRMSCASQRAPAMQSVTISPSSTKVLKLMILRLHRVSEGDERVRADVDVSTFGSRVTLYWPSGRGLPRVGTDPTFVINP